MMTMSHRQSAPPLPDVVLIMTDQHRVDHVGFGGNAVVRTPHLDRLAARSVVFDRAHVANPMCMPNRASIASGLMPSVHGTRYNGLALDPRQWTFTRGLRGAGYRTAIVGKLHLQNMGNHPEMIPLVIDQCPAPDVRRLAAPAGWDTWELLSRYDSDDAEHDVPADFYGFDHVELVVDHADVAGGHYRRWLRANGLDPAKVQGRGHALQATELWDQIWQPACGEANYTTTFVAERAVEVIRSTPTDQPLMLQCSFPDPHHPFTPPGRYYEMYDPDDMELPATFHDAHERSMPHLQQLVGDRGNQFFPLAPWSPTEAQFRAALAAEYGSISMIDDAVGRVVKALEEAGRDDSVVVFTSDHGDMFGDHGLMQKASMRYGGSLRPPLTIAAPGVLPRRSDSLVSSLDIAATVLELVGLECPFGQQGRSLVSIMHGDDAAGRSAVLVEEDQMFDMAQVGQPLRMRTVVTDRFRYTRYAGAAHGELFDLRDDPDELDNRFSADAPTALQHDAHEVLLELMMRFADETRRPTHMA